MDFLLDKIKASGRESLTPKEKDILNRISNGEDMGNVPTTEDTPIVHTDQGRLMVGDEPVDIYQARQKSDKPGKPGKSKKPIDETELRIYYTKGEKSVGFYLWWKNDVVRYKTHTAKDFGSFFSSDKKFESKTALWKMLDKRYTGHEVVNKADTAVFIEFVDLYKKYKDAHKEDKDVKPTRRLQTCYEYIRRRGDEIQK